LFEIKETDVDEMRTLSLASVRKYALTRVAIICGSHLWNNVWGFTDIRFFSFFIAESLCGHHEKRLLNHLLANYNTLERPVAN